MSFTDLNLSESLLRAVREADYQTATPIQVEAIPHILSGRDVLGCAQTGTGKTAAFALPALQRLSERSSQQESNPQLEPNSQPERHPQQDRNSHPYRNPQHRSSRAIRTLVLVPTRELASQIAESFRTYGRYTGLRHTVVFGGVGQQPQVKAMQRGVDILIATPGRLLDLMNQGFVDLSRVEMLILDEADQMLDMGFIHDLKRIVSRVPRQRQTLLFSATMPQEIRRLADQWLRDPVEVSVAPQATPAERVEQSVYFVGRGDKAQLLAQYLRDQSAQRALVFTKTKHGADKVVRSLQRAGFRAEAIHGNKSQNARQRALAQFKSHQPPVLVATDIASRGLDIDAVSHVINFDLPMTAEIYVHRIGRTARAGASGIAVTFCDRDERTMLRDIERLTRQRLTIAECEFTNKNEPMDSSTRRVDSERVDSEKRHRPTNETRYGRPNRKHFGKPQQARHKAAGPGRRFGGRLSTV